MNISSKLYRLRTEQGLTQADLGKIAGVSDKTISAWEAGARCPKVVPFIQNICNYFQLDMLTFIDEGTDSFGEETQPTVSDGLTDKDIRLVEWFRSLPGEKQKAILSLAGAPEDLAE